jgi:hypothetical protein
LVVILLLIVVAAVSAIPFLSNPYFAIAEVLIYAGLVAVVAAQLITCLRLARGSEYTTKLRVVGFWVGAAAFILVCHLDNLLRTEDRTYIQLATSGAAYLALIFALRLVEQLLRREPAGIRSTPDESTSAGAQGPPNQPLQATGAP